MEVMSRISTPKAIGIATACAALGAAGGVIGSAGASSSHAPSHAGAKAGFHHRHVRARVLRRVVHANLVVAARHGRFVHATLDRGTVKAVQGDKLTLREGTRRATYKTVTVTLPANARVRVDRHPAQLSDVKPGQRAAVLQAPKRAFVRAHDIRTHP
jgi:hypothetical protein